LASAKPQAIALVVIMRLCSQDSTKDGWD